MQNSSELLSICSVGCCLTHDMLNKASKIFKFIFLTPVRESLQTCAIVSEVSFGGDLLAITLEARLFHKKQIFHKQTERLVLPSCLQSPSGRRTTTAFTEGSEGPAVKIISQIHHQHQHHKGLLNFEPELHFAAEVPCREQRRAPATVSLTWHVSHSHPLAMFVHQPPLCIMMPAVLHILEKCLLNICWIKRRMNVWKG